eukprot:4637788-Prymnesium_polylepis.1
MVDRLEYISLGQGQGPKAEKMITDGKTNGKWVLLMNCHLYVSWMATLEKEVEDTDPAKTDPSYRLWLTSMPSAKFPVSVLQNGCVATPRAHRRPPWHTAARRGTQPGAMQRPGTQPPALACDTATPELTRSACTQRVNARSVKMTNEPPKGLRANLMTNLSAIPEERFEATTKPDSWRKIMFGQ